MNNVTDVVERHYWKAVGFLVVLILAGTSLWGVRRFAPTLFLGEPDLIAVPKPDKPVLLNINTATAAELQTLPDIGEGMAKRIVDHRTQHGDFSSVDALQDVKGIGANTIEKLRPFVDAK